jgi:pimeloyl-ACP methyl ester carboxylesterase
MDLNMVTVGPTTGTRRHPILFVHGAWHGAWCWEPFMEWFAERGWTCHALDLRGHGESPTDRSLRRTRIQHYVEDVVSVVDSLDQAPVIVAHSMGTLVTQKLLETRTLPGAVLLAPIPLGGAWRATGRVAVRHPLRFLQANLTWDLGPLVSTRSIARDLFFSDDTPDEDVDRWWPKLQRESYPAYLDMLFFVRARPQLIETPVSIVSGESDRIFSVAEHRRMSRPYGTDLVVIEGGPHDLMLGPRWERAAEAVAAVLEP